MMKYDKKTDDAAHRQSFCSSKGVCFALRRETLLATAPKVSKKAA